jgi:7-carboxy-7-deazaguanine synthase
MLVSEIFLSIQGESTYVGLPCVFIRLSGCNLACSWCDTVYARTAEGGTEYTVEGIIREVKKFKAWLVEITGGEPLLQEETLTLAKRLMEEGYRVLLETNGSVGLSGVPEGVVKIVDVKCPSSGVAGAFLMDNLDYITPEDEVKFVIANAEDYEFAKGCMEECIKDLTEKILFAPVRPDMDPAVLAEWILRDGIKVRLQAQMHSFIWQEGRGR